jgi:cytochrome P450
MAINIKDMSLPKFHPWFLPDDRSVNDLIKEGVELAKTNWIADSIFGYTILSNKDSSAILKDSKWHNAIKFFLNQNYDGDDIFHKQKTGILISLEGIEHNRLKKLVSPYFTPTRSESNRPLVRRIVESICEDHLDSEHFDIQKDIFNRVSGLVLCEILGIPKKDINKFIEWTDIVFLNVGIVKKDNAEYIKKAVNEFIDYIDELVTQRRLDLKNDLISDLIRAEDEKDYLSNDEIIMLTRVVLASGVDTGRSQLGLTFNNLARKKEIWNRLPIEQELLKSEVNETFNMNGVIKQLGRFASEDIEYNGILFPKGTIVFPSISIPNINEPDEPVLTFGRGIHYCLGAALASVIVEETMGIVSKLFPDIEILDNLGYKESHRSSAGFVSIPVQRKGNKI